VGGKWVRGHAARGEGGFRGPRLIPPPDDSVWDDDVGELEPDDIGPAPGIAPEPAETASPTAPIEAGPALPPEPGKAKGWNFGKPKTVKGKPPKLTAAVVKDIDAKISFALEVPARVWAARDPVCGGTFVAQRGEISAALTEIVCQSSDLVAWFSGSGGQFMLWLNLAAACWPVATVVMAHHVYHSIETADQPLDTTQYAAL
jgi:hypothetical protein